MTCIKNLKRSEARLAYLVGGFNIKKCKFINQSSQILGNMNKFKSINWTLMLLTDLDNITPNERPMLINLFEMVNHKLTTMVSHE